MRAGVVSVERLREHRYSSYWYLWEPRQRPTFLNATTALNEAGGLPDRRQGWVAYQQYLGWQVQSGPAGVSKAYASLSHGWALGSREFKEELLQRHELLALSRAWETVGAQEIRHLEWTRRLQTGLRMLGRDVGEAAGVAKSAEWKVALAWWMKRSSQASNRWLAEHLPMGRPEAVSVYVRRLTRSGPLIHSACRRLSTIVST